jgi:hypothetical protein
MGDCLACLGRTVSIEKDREPNPFVVAKLDRERGKAIHYHVIGPHEGSSRPRR